MSRSRVSLVIFLLSVIGLLGISSIDNPLSNDTRQARGIGPPLWNLHSGKTFSSDAMDLQSSSYEESIDEGVTSTHPYSASQNPQFTTTVTDEPASQANSADPPVDLDANSVSQTDNIVDSSSTDVKTFRVGAVLRVSGQTVQNVYAWQFAINYDPTVITPQADPVPLSGSESADATVKFGGQTNCGFAGSWRGLIPTGAFGSYVTSENLTTHTGKIQVFYTLLGNVSGKTINNNCLLANVAFELVSEPATPQVLTISDVKFLDNTLKTIGNVSAGSSATETITNDPPHAAFSIIPGPTPSIFTFNASESTDSDGFIPNPAGYFWDLGDETTDLGVTGPTVTHDYGPINGTFTVTLRVQDNLGATGSARDSLGVSINNQQPSHVAQSVDIVIAAHEVAVTGIVTSRSTAYSGVVSLPVNVNVTVTSMGGSSDTFWVAAMANTTLIGNQTATLAYGQSAIVTFNWNANLLPPGSYPLTGLAQLVAGDANPLNNNLMGPVFYVRFRGDISGDCTVNIVDLAMVGMVFGSTPLAPSWNPNTDLNNDGAVDIIDLTLVGGNFGQQCPGLERPPVAKFSENATSALTGIAISFDASTSFDPDGSIVSYLWDFGDGTNATGVTVAHSYTTAGVYTVTLTVTDNSGNTNSATALKTVIDRPPVAVLSENATSAQTGEVISFDASASFDPDGTIVGYEWEFGDGSTGSGVAPSHSYAKAGDYTVKLTVTDNHGNTDMATAVKTILDRSPVVGITEDKTTAFRGEAITLTITASDPDGSIVSITVDWGDGTVNSLPGNATSDSHAYSSLGTFNVTVTATDDNGSTTSATAKKTILDIPPRVSFTEDKTTAFRNQTITLTITSADSDGVIVYTIVDWGDGTVHAFTGAASTDSHAYSSLGAFTVLVTVIDNDGSTASATATKTILNNPPTVSFTEDKTSALTLVDITLTIASSDSDGTIVETVIDWSDGTIHVFVGAANSDVHAYATAGTYEVTVTVRDNDGGSGSAMATKVIEDRSPVAKFREDATTVLTLIAINYDASDSFDSDGTIVSYSWSFGDNSTGSGVMVAHSYAKAGNYTVTLTVTDNNGNTDSTTSIKTILNRQPVPSFTESATTALTADVIMFDATASADPDGTIVSYAWDFGDGGTGSGVMVNHTYTVTGNYTVKLTVTDDHSNTDMTTALKVIMDRPPEVSFTENVTTAFRSQTIVLNITSSDPDGVIVDTIVDWGDGTVHAFSGAATTDSHAYLSLGIFNVTVTVTDNDGSAASSTAKKTIINEFPAVNFTEDKTTALTLENITLTITASDPDGTIVSITVDWGDGTVDTLLGNATSDTHAYAKAGTYNVTVTVTDDDGATASATSTKTILNRSPVVGFTEDKSTALTAESITLAISGFDPDGTIVQTRADWGDGFFDVFVGLQTTASHSYATAGTYTVTVTVTDDDGSTGSFFASKTIIDRPPVACFTEDLSSPLTGVSISFDASCSFDVDGVVVSYSWDFGDLTTGTGVLVSHSYATAGTYTVELTVTDNHGNTGMASSTKTIIDRSPVVSFNEDKTTAFRGEFVTLTISGSDPDGSIVETRVDWGDGFFNVFAGLQTTATHSYSSLGSFTVTVTLTDNSGSAASATSTKSTINSLPIVSFTEDRTTVARGEFITLAIGSSDADGTIASTVVDWGDGTVDSFVGAAASDSHAYSSLGSFTVTVTVTDNDGATGSASATKTLVNLPPVASFAESATSVLTGISISFDASASSDPDAGFGDTIVSYAWDFGDGIMGSGAMASHAYAKSGTYTATLTVTDNNGSTGTTSTVKTIINRPPVVTFTEDKTTAFRNDTITLTITSSDPDGTISTTKVDWGDDTVHVFMGAVTTDSHAYLSLGVFNVTVTVTDNDGSAASATAKKTIVNELPAVSFTEDFTTRLTLENITMTMTASDSDGTVISLRVDWGDGTVHTLPGNATSDVHAYATAGSYMVTVTVTDTDGATASAMATKTIQDRPPVASFTESTTSALTGVSISFNATASSDPDGTIVSYAWDFGDLTTGSGVTVSHSYAVAGIYTVTLTVTDNHSSTGTASAAKTIINRPPVACFTESTTSALTGDPLSFDASCSSDADGAVVSYSWDFGDLTTGSGVIVNHSYAVAGTYTVTLTVTDNNGDTGTFSATKTIINRPPTVTFTEDKSSALTAELITLIVSGSDPDGTISQTRVDWGDSFFDVFVGLQTTASHSYAKAGSYTVTVTVTDDMGATDSSSSVKTIIDRPPVAVIAESTTSAMTDVSISFDGTGSSDPDGTVVSYMWDFGDGGTAAGATATHAYATAGTYTVTLTVSDDNGSVGSTTAIKTIIDRPPVACFTESTTSALTGVSISFDASCSTDPDGIVVSYSWNFGDGSPLGSGVTTSHSYAVAGNYTVVLTVADDHGNTDTATAIKTILDRSPAVSFTENLTTASRLDTITLNITSSDPDGNVVQTVVDWGDGTIHTFAGAATRDSHAYSSLGMFNVTVTVTDNDGSSASATATKIIVNEPPIISFTEDKTNALTGENITLTITASDSDGTVVSITVDWGDGTVDTLPGTATSDTHAYAGAGTYNVTLTVTDDNGSTNSTSATKSIVADQPFVAKFSENTAQILTSSATGFDASTTLDLDGSDATDTITTQFYAPLGMYVLTPTVTDSGRLTDSTANEKTIVDKEGKPR